MSNARLVGAISEDGRAPVVDPVTVSEVLQWAAIILRATDAADHKREARDILAAVLGEPRSWPLLHEDVLLSDDEVARVLDAFARRRRGAPFAYAVRQSTFRHLTLDVDERVLIPRPETEVLVDVVLEWAAHSSSGSGLAIDVGTGSGAIALALASEGSFGRVIATDISSGAVRVAQGNARRLAGMLRTPVEFRQGSVLSPVSAERACAVVSNPPYIAYREMLELPPSVRNWEPPTALYAADGGMAVIAALARQAAEVLKPGGLLAMEIDCRRGAACAELLRAQGCYHDVRVRPDLTGRDRVLTATRQDG